MASTCGHDLSLSYEIAGNIYGLIEQAARIVAEVENERLQLAACLLPQRSLPPVSAQHPPAR